MAFGETAYSGSRFIFWCLTPFLLISGLGLPFMLLINHDLVAILTMIAWCLCSLLAIPALYDSKRYWWAARGVTAIIFLAYSTYIVIEFFVANASFRRIESIAGFIVIGLPCLWYTIFQRFSLRPEIYDDSEYEFLDEEEDY